MFKQTATYWAPNTVNEYAERSYSTPTTIPVRWENRTETFLDKAAGKEVRSHAVVYVETDIDTDGFLYLGTSVVSDPDNVDGAFRIRRFDKTVSVKGNKFLRKVWL